MKCVLEVPYTKFVKIGSVTYFSDRRKLICARGFHIARQILVKFVIGNLRGKPFGNYELRGNRCSARRSVPTGTNANFHCFFTSFFRFGKIRYGGRPQKFLSGSEFCENQCGVPRTLLNGVHKFFEVLSAFIVRLG
jgi:hypothetical protein